MKGADMDKSLILNEEQTLLRDTLRRWLADGREAADKARNGATRADWRALAEMGLVGLMVPEASGGAGCGPAELAVAAAELGRALAPLPFAPMVAGGVTLLAEGAPDRLPAVIAGERVVTYADGRDGSFRVDATGRVAGDLGSVPGVVIADMVLLATCDSGGRARLWLTDMAEGTAAPLAEGDEAEALLACTDDLVTLARLADTVGAMEEMLRLTVEHLNTRRQFGRPLAGFQALQHRVADMFAEIELARSMVISLVAASAAEADPVARRHAAAAARLQVILAADRVGPEAIQLHGGMGMSWEHRVGHLARRALSTGLRMGGADAALDELGALPGLITA